MGFVILGLTTEFSGGVYAIRCNDLLAVSLRIFNLPETFLLVELCASQLTFDFSQLHFLLSIHFYQYP
ncbi:hypothetical protein, partial [Candidatus Hakubella thermalkaliphila]|uniref:hypothetical protein n=1 Tax=Candidatus Hakubella thermalkaliphila TaxID=2754717 RepID=UPI001C61218A